MPRRPKPDQSVAVAYIRVSTSKQELGPEAQRQAILRWCERYGVTLACNPITDQGKSGGLDFEKRPGLLQAVDALESHNAAILVAHKRDRIARDLAVMGKLRMLLRQKGRRICTTERPPGDPDVVDPMEKAMEGMQDVFAELERSMIRARVKAALQVKRLRGERVGTIPYGYKLAADGVQLLPDRGEQKTIRLVKKLHHAGKSLRQIGAELAERGFTPKRGKHWGPSTIKKILEFEPPP